MNKMVDEIKNLEETLVDKFGITKLAIFGSYAKGLQTSESDVDILIIAMNRKNGFTIARAQRFLSTHLNKVVDLGLYDALRPFMKKRLASEIIDVY